MTRDEAIKKAEENLRNAETRASAIQNSVDYANTRVRIARGWLDLARELDRL
jgi:hypothetical protein